VHAYAVIDIGALGRRRSPQVSGIGSQIRLLRKVAVTCRTKASKFPIDHSRFF
jgi:hypothetical protein